MSGNNKRQMEERFIAQGEASQPSQAEKIDMSKVQRRKKKAKINTVKRRGMKIQKEKETGEKSKKIKRKKKEERHQSPPPSPVVVVKKQRKQNVRKTPKKQSEVKLNREQKDKKLLESQEQTNSFLYQLLERMDNQGGNLTNIGNILSDLFHNITHASTPATAYAPQDNQNFQQPDPIISSHLVASNAGMYDSNGQWNVAMSHVQNDPMLGGAADPTTINSPHQTEEYNQARIRDNTLKAHTATAFLRQTKEKLQEKTLLFSGKHLTVFRYPATDFGTSSILKFIRHGLNRYTKIKGQFPIKVTLQFGCLLAKRNISRSIRLREYYPSWNTSHGPSYNITGPGNTLRKIENFLNLNPVEKSMINKSIDLNSDWVYVCALGMTLMISHKTSKK